MDNRGGGGLARFPGLLPRPVPAGWPPERPPLLAGTNMPAVFAAGNVRPRSVKRVASATGEGAIAIQLLHQYPQALDSGRHPQRRRRINRGLPAVVLHVGQAPGLRRQVPDTVLGMESGLLEEDLA